jgi:DNA-binding NarL/FixJ family response regulator
MVLGRGIARRAVGLLATSPSTGAPFPQLTEREGEVLTLIARGLDNAAIARSLFLTTKTVRNYVYAIFTKLDVNDRAALVVKARDAGVGLDRPT